MVISQWLLTSKVFFSSIGPIPHRKQPHTVMKIINNKYSLYRTGLCLLYVAYSSVLYCSDEP